MLPVNKLMKGKALRKHSLHEETAASVSLKPFSSNQQQIIFEVMLRLQRRHFGAKTGNHLSGYQVVIEWLSSGG